MSWSPPKLGHDWSVPVVLVLHKRGVLEISQASNTWVDIYSTLQYSVDQTRVRGRRSNSRVI